MPEFVLQRPSPAALADVLDIMADAVIMVDAHQRIVFFNRGAEQIFGWRASDVLGQSLRILLPERFARGHDRQMNAFAGGTVRARLMGERQEVVARRKDGSEFPAEVSIAKQDEGGEVLLTAVLRDATERKRREQSLNEAVKALSQREAALSETAEKLRASREELHALSRKLVDSLEDERRTIALELHDEAGQSLTAVLIELGMIEQECRRSAAHLVQPIGELKRSISGVMEGLHRLSRSLRPASLDRLGLVTALREHIQSFEQQTGIEVGFAPVHFENGNGRLPGEIEIVVYRVVQEALTNVARHAHARHAGVILKRKSRRVLAIVEDDGSGFDVDEALEGGRLGLMGMRERAEILGGHLTIESAAGRGTTVFLDIPTAPGAGDEEGPEG